MIEKIFDYVFLDKMPDIDKMNEEIDNLAFIFDIDLMSKEELIFLSLFINFLYESSDTHARFPRNPTHKNIYGVRSEYLLLQIVGENFIESYGVEELWNVFKNDCICKNFHKHEMMEILISWVVSFRKINFDIVKILNLWLKYTDVYFSIEDVTKALKTLAYDTFK